MSILPHVIHAYISYQKKKITEIVNLPHLKKSVYACCNFREAMEIRKLQRLTLQHCNLRSGKTTDFDRYKKFKNSRAKPPRASARHIGFVIYFKIAQTCILCHYNTNCKQIGRKSNCLLVKRLNVKTKRK